MNDKIRFSIFIFFFNFLFSQSIYHDSIGNVQPSTPIEVQVFTDLNNQSYMSYNLFYRINGQVSFFQQPMLEGDNGYYFSIIQPNHNIVGQIDYYIRLEMLNGEIITFPQISPIEYPLQINIIDEDITNINSISDLNLLQADVSIISPLPFETVFPEDLIVSLSYFQLDELDVNSIKIFIDNINLTNRAIIKRNHLVLEPPRLKDGKHKIILNMKNLSGVSFEPIQWIFNVVSDEKSLTKINNFEYNGKIWNDYISNKVDSLESAYNVFNFNFNGKTEWLDFSIKYKKNSLENIYEQPKDRYTFKLGSDNVKFKFGDFYPNLGDYSLNGTRVRGAGFNVNTEYFQFNIIQGELNQFIEGNPLDDALVISDLSNQYIDEFNPNQSILTLSRDNYTFKRDITGLRIALGSKQKANFGLNIVKAKDDINSINKFVPGAVINLEKLTEQFNSDQFIDFDNDNQYTCSVDGDDTNDDMIYNIDGTLSNCNDGVDIYYPIVFNSSEFINYDDDNIVEIGTYIDDNDNEYSIKQRVWDIDVLFDDLETVLNNNATFDTLDIQVDHLSEQWDGDKPEDNFVIGTDMNLNFNNVVKIKSGMSMSLSNSNTWNPVKTVEDFDTYADEYEDCYYGRTYSNNFPEDYYWNECLAYEADGTPISLIIDESGIELSAIPDPESFSSIFHYNFDSTPLIPFYSLLQKSQNDESIELSDLLNSPEVAYNFDVVLSLKKQKIQFGIKKIGGSYNSLGNPYLQKDSRERYFSDTFRFFKNKLYINLKWKDIKNGLIDGVSSSRTEKYDVNFSIYPGIDLPSVTLGYGIYNKTSGTESSLVDTTWDSSIPDDIPDSTFDDLSSFDSRLETETKNINFTFSQNINSNFNHSLSLSYFSSDKIDLLFDELILTNSEYISPRSMSESVSFNLKTRYDKSWSSTVYMTNNYFDFAQESSIDYFQKQLSSMFSVGFTYTDNNFLDKLNASIDYSIGKGSTKYNQVGIKLLTKLDLYKNLDMTLDFSKRFKTITTVVDSDSESSKTEDRYSNFIFKANIAYKF